LRFADQKMNMFWHDHVTNDNKLIASAHLFQDSKKTGRDAAKCQAAVAANNNCT